MPYRTHLLPVLAVLLGASLVVACGDDDAPTARDADPTPAPSSPVPSSTVPSSPVSSSPVPAPPPTDAPAATTGDTPDVGPVGAEVGDANEAEVNAFLSAPGADGPFYMVNLIRFRDRAEYADGRETDLTGEEADAIYGEFMRTTKLPEIGAELVYVADVEQDLIGGTAFDRVGVVRYPSRAAFAAMTEAADFREMSVHKQAGVADTVVLATSLIDAPAVPPLADPPFPATADDPPFAFMHVLDYRETAVYAEGDADADPTRSGEDAVGLYSSNAGTVAVPLGVRPLAWFAVEATIIGPPGVWDEVRINWFPSHATFDALTSDPTWQTGTHHRTAGLEQTYAIMTAPAINAFLAESPG